MDGMPGDTFPPESRVRNDLMLHPGFTVTQLTTRGTLNYCQYFTHSSWMKNEHGEWELVITSDRDDRGMDFYSIHPRTNVITRLTRGANAVPFAWAVSGDGSTLVYFGGHGGNGGTGGNRGDGGQEEIHRVRLDTGGFEDELILERPPGYRGWTRGIISLAPDNDTFYVDGVGDRSRMVPSNLFKGSLSKGTFEPVFDEEMEAGNFFCHSMICPANPDILQVNRTPASDVGKEAPQRMWLLDTRTGRLEPLYKHRKDLLGRVERVGHECWHPSGKYMVFVVRRNKVKACEVQGEFGQENAWTCGKGPNFWHVSASPNGDLLCADTMWRDTGLWLVEFVPGFQGRIINICRTRSGWNSPVAREFASRLSSEQERAALAQAHPHPGWSPDGRHVQFTAFHEDEGGVHVFLVDVGRFSF